jgi:hypothetical protein
MELIENITDLSNIYGIPAESVKTVIEDIFKFAFDDRYTVFFDEDNNIRFISNDSYDGNIYSLQDVKRKGSPQAYSSYKSIRQFITTVFPDVLVSAASKELYFRYKQLKGQNVKGVVISKIDKDYIVLLNNYNIVSFLPENEADRNFEFDPGAEYEFNVSVIKCESDSFKITLSRINHMFIKNIIEREYKIPVIVLHREALKFSYIYSKVRISDEQKQRLKALIGEEIIFTNKISKKNKNKIQHLTKKRL